MKSIKDNWHIFDPKISQLREKLEQKQNDDILKSFKAGGMDGLFKGSQKNSLVRADLPPYFSKYLKVMTERLAQAK